MTLAVKVVLNPNTTNKPTNPFQMTLQCMCIVEMISRERGINSVTITIISSQREICKAFDFTLFQMTSFRLFQTEGGWR